MADFDVFSIADDGDDVESYWFGTMVAADVIVGHADNIQPFLMVDSLLGG